MRVTVGDSGFCCCTCVTYFERYVLILSSRFSWRALVNKDQSGFDVAVTVKKSATTVHDDSASCVFSTSTLTMEMEAVIHAIRWIASTLTMEMEAVIHAIRWIASRGDSQTTHAVILAASMSLLQKVKNMMRSPDWRVSTFGVHLFRLLWMCCPGHDGVKGNDREATDTSQVACVSDDLKC